MMSIVEALKSENNIYIRLTYSRYDFTRWLVCDDTKFFVYERKRRAKKTVTLIETESEEEAVEILLK